MSTTIPYDPSLVLGNIVVESHLKNLEAISKVQSPLDADLQALNSAILIKRKLTMTIQDLVNMGVDPKPVADALKDIDKEITTTAGKYAKDSAKALPQIAKMRGQIQQVGESIESPIDYNSSSLKQMPLAADSLTMDCQYFSYDKEGQSSESVMAQITTMVSHSSSKAWGWKKRSEQASSAVQSQLNSQHESHDIEGTLVITANCTHKEAQVFAPFIIDVDKAIRAWNELVKRGELTGKGVYLDTDSRASFEAVAQQSASGDEAYYNLLSGATYGSSFVGMVHVLRQSSRETSQRMYSAAASMAATMKVGGWYASEEGSFGVNSQFSDSVKRLLSQMSVSSHCSLVVMGLIPSIKANTITYVLKEMDLDPAKMMSKVQDMQNTLNQGQVSVNKGASDAKAGALIQNMAGAQMTSAMSQLQKGDTESNKIIDTNTMMTAFEDYVNKAAEGKAGVPIEYYLKPITAKQLLQMWTAKYFPGEYLAVAGDDSKQQGAG